MRRTIVRRSNPVARALLTCSGLKHRIVPARKCEKRARDKLRQLLRSHDHIAGSIQIRDSFVN